MKPGRQVCDVCGKPGVRLERIVRSFGRGASLLVIENVPVMACPRCRETYLTAETLRKLERIRRHRRTLAKRRPVSVAVFPDPADVRD